MLTLPRFSDRLPSARQVSLGLVVTMLALLSACHYDLDPIRCMGDEVCGEGKQCLGGTCVPIEDYSPDRDTSEDTPPEDSPSVDVDDDTVDDPGDDPTTDVPHDGDEIDESEDVSVDATSDPRPTDLGELQEVTDPCSSCFPPRTCVTLSGDACWNTTSICAPATFTVNSLDLDGERTLQITFSLIPQSDFLMGSSSETDPNAEDDEEPLHEVAMGAFYISDYEITAEQYAACVLHGDCEAADSLTASDNAACVSPELTGSPILTTPQAPMNCVSRAGAAQFCSWIGGRLPTEAEWERAARGACGRGDATDTCTIGSVSTLRDNILYPWGDVEPTCNRACWSGETCTQAAPCEVGSFDSGRSREGIYDLAGNVAEWVSDGYDAESYTSHGEDAICPAPVVGPTNGIVRGGSFEDQDAANLRAADRVETPPEDRTPSVGIRCVVDVPSSS